MEVRYNTAIPWMHHAKPKTCILVAWVVISMSGLVFGMSGLVFLVSGLLFWVSGLVFWGVWTCILGVWSYFWGDLTSMEFDSIYSMRAQKQGGGWFLFAGRQSAAGSCDTATKWLVCVHACLCVLYIYIYIYIYI